MNELVVILEETEKKISEVEKELLGNPDFKHYAELLKSKENIEKDIKEYMKKETIDTLEGNEVLFYLQISNTRKRIYDLEKIKGNEILKNQVMVQSVNEKVFEVLEKQGLIEEAQEYYKVNVKERARSVYRTTKEEYKKEKV
jgi:hypothetical protein